jgi:hypothetical protein
MGLPNKIVYAIRAASARCQRHGLPRERQPLFHCNPKALQIRRQPESPYFFLTSSGILVHFFTGNSAQSTAARPFNSRALIFRTELRLAHPQIKPC